MSRSAVSEMGGDGVDDGFADLLVVGLISVFAHHVAASVLGRASAKAACDGFRDECGCVGRWRDAGGAEMSAEDIDGLLGEEEVG